MQLADGLTQRVLVAGPVDGPPLLLLHGWAVSAYLWRATIPALAAAGFRVYVPDLPGHGLSDAPQEKGSYSVDAFTERALMLCDALALDSVQVIGQSMGGRIAMEMVFRAPTRISRVALFGPVGFGDIPPGQTFAPFLPSLPGALASLLVTRQMVDIVQRRVWGKIGWFTERDVDEYWAPSQFPDVVRAQLQMLREFEWAPIADDRIRTVKTPALIVFGTQDRTVRPVHAERLVSVLPQGRLEWIEGGGHVVMEEVPELVNRMLLGFLTGV